MGKNHTITKQLTIVKIAQLLNHFVGANNHRVLQSLDLVEDLSWGIGGCMRMCNTWLCVEKEREQTLL
jgi:hypothetical protein